MLDEGQSGFLLTFQLKSLQVVENLHLDKMYVYYFQYLLTAYYEPNILLAGYFLNELTIYFRDLAMDVI